MDKSTMVRELAHAWAALNLSNVRRQHFVAWRHLDSWNDQDDQWERRGTEHVAETIAWGLMDESSLIRWMTTAADGSQIYSYRPLTLGIDSETLAQNFEFLTGEEPVGLYTDEGRGADLADAFSPELMRPETTPSTLSP